MGLTIQNAIIFKITTSEIAGYRRATAVNLLRSVAFQLSFCRNCSKLRYGHDFRQAQPGTRRGAEPQKRQNRHHMRLHRDLISYRPNNLWGGATVQRIMQVMGVVMVC